MSETSQREKPAMVLIHGLLADSRMWLGQTGELNTAYHVFNWDLPGFGREPPLTGVKSGLLEATTDWLADKMSGEGLHGACVAGYSLGTSVALTLALRHPQLVGKLALVAGAAQWGGGPRTWAAECPSPAYAVLRLKLRRNLRCLLKDPERLAMALEMTRTADPGTGRGLLAEILAADLTPRLSALNVPALVISGGSDPLATPDRADALQKALPNARRLIFPGGGHYICITHANELAKALAEFGNESTGDGTQP